MFIRWKLHVTQPCTPQEGAVLAAALAFQAVFRLVLVTGTALGQGAALGSRAFCSQSTCLGPSPAGRGLGKGRRLSWVHTHSPCQVRPKVQACATEIWNSFCLLSALVVFGVFQNV